MPIPGLHMAYAALFAVAVDLGLLAPGALSALANEVLNKGKPKSTIRKAAVAIGLLNEATNR